MMLDALNGVYDWLVTQNKFELMLIALEAELSVTIVRPTRIVVGEDVSKQYPLMELLGAESNPEYVGEGGYAAQGYETDDVDVMAYHSDNDPAKVRSTLLYWDLALFRIIKADNTFGNKFNRVRRGPAPFSDMYKRKSGGPEPYLQIMRRRLRVRTTFEERSA